ncbi:hypothetical protein B0H12DRAFT_1268053, partial [Mycena haematopus]
TVTYLEGTNPFTARVHGPLAHSIARGPLQSSARAAWAGFGLSTVLIFSCPAMATRLRRPLFFAWTRC